MSILLEKNQGHISYRKVSFNNERDILLCTTENGYSLINCCPIIPVITKNLCQYGFSCVDIYKRSNILVFSGTDKTVKYKSNILYVFADDKDIEIARLVFDTPIVNCQIHSNYILVILNDYTYVYTFDQLKLYAKYPTFSNPKGIGALQINNGEPMILTLGKSKGTIRVSYGKREERLFRAHESAIGCLCLSRDCEFIASASVRGSIIRIFSTKVIKCISVIRRGHLHASIINMEFDKHTNYLLCNSDTTLHVAKRTSRLSQISESNNNSSQLNEFSNSFSIRYTNPDHSKSMLAVFGSEPESIYLVTTKGLFQKLSFNGDRNLVVFQHSLLTDCHLYLVYLNID